MISNATGIDGDATFAEVFELTNIKLIITATCLNTSTSFYFSHDTTADTPISEALAISVNIPLIFTSKTFEDKMMVDGGVVEHLPMECWSDEDIPNTLAFLVKSKNEVFHTNGERTINCMYDYLESVLHTLNKRNNESYYEKYEDTIAIIDAGNLTAYKRIPSTTTLNQTVHTTYFQTLSILHNKNFISRDIPRQGGISSFILPDDSDTSSIGTDSEEDDRKKTNDYVDTAYQIVLLTSFIIIIFSILKMLRKF
jgi:predicted patatin/cPLA2 family phospholipase